MTYKGKTDIRKRSISMINNIISDEKKSVSETKIFNEIFTYDYFIKKDGLYMVCKLD